MKLFFYSLRSRIFLSTTLLVVLLSLTFGWISISQQTASLQQALIERGQITARHLAYAVELGILTRDITGLDKLLHKLLDEKDVLYAEVYDTNGELITAATSVASRSMLIDPDNGSDTANIPSRATWEKSSFDRRAVYEFHMPVSSEINASEEAILLDGPGGTVQQTIGAIHVALGTDSIQAAIRSIIINGIGTFLVLLLLALLTVWWLARALTRPLEHMSRVIENTQSGHFNHRIELVGQNEITLLAQSFNNMLDTLAERDASLHEQQRMMQVLLDTAPIGIWMMNTERRIIFINRAFSSAVGIPEQDFLAATHYTELLPDAVAEQCMASDQRCFETETLTNSHEHIPCVDGKVHRFDVVKAPLRDNDGNMAGLVGLAIDATERLEADAEKEQMQKQVEHTQRLESLGVLAGGIAHDFNNILTSILGNASLAQRRLGHDASKEQLYLSKIIQSSEKAALLCKQMLAYSGKGHFIIKPLNLSTMVKNVTSLLGVSIHRSIELKYRLCEHLPDIEADEAQLQQVIMNLVINASDAIGENSGVITLATGSMQADTDYLKQSIAQPGVTLKAGGYVYLEVCDSGCGMDTATQQRLFEPFFTTKFAGRGLGMSAVQGIVRGHHGAMCLYSEPGKGTTFKVLFPAADSTGATPVNTPAKPCESWRGSGSILIIDDEEMIRETAACMLEDMGFDTLTAVDGLDGVEVYRRHQQEIVAVLLDMTMPKLDGEGCFLQLKQINPDVTVILSSGYNEKESTERFTGHGLAGFVQKPYSSAMLQEAMQRLCSAVRGKHQGNTD